MYGSRPENLPNGFRTVWTGLKQQRRRGLVNQPYTRGKCVKTRGKWAEKKRVVFLRPLPVCACARTGGSDVTAMHLKGGSPVYYVLV